MRLFPPMKVVSHLGQRRPRSWPSDQSGAREDMCPIVNAFPTRTATAPPALTKSSGVMELGGEP